jgi:exodeoxyribonuclease-5
MVSKDIHEDLLSFDLPIVYVGDHGQLEPVSSERDGFCLMRDPDVALETIHRNAGEIARFAEWLRNGNDAADWTGNAGQVSVVTGDQMASCGMEAADQLICAYNRTRCAMNDAVREHLGLPGSEPVVGDRVICLQNDRERGLFNGMQGVLTAINTGKRWLSFRDEDGRQYEYVPYVAEAFGAEKTPKRVPGRVPFDWAYCCTAHKMQGSEADNVMVLEQRCDLWDMRRWNYTAASRAKRKLTWVMG